MADVSSIVSNWLQGNNITDVTPGQSGPVDETTVLQASDSVEDGDNSSTDIQASEEQVEGSQSESADSDTGKKKPEEKISADKEVITISDDKGRRKVEIDYSNKDQIKKYVQMAYGARKWQAERDAARQEVEPLRTQLSDMRNNWETLENAFRSKGVEGVVDLLEGKPGSYKAHLDKAMQRAEFIRRASPEELEALEAKEAAQAKSEENSRLRKEFEELKAQVEGEKVQAELHSVESKVHPTFFKYGFDGKLGDASDEAMFNEMLWKTAMDRLVPYEEQYGSAAKIPQELIEKEFRTVSQAIRKRIGAQAEKKASQVIEQKKTEAIENVQAKVQSGYQTGGLRKEADKLIQSRDITSLLRNWGKYSSAFGKK